MATDKTRITTYVDDALHDRIVARAALEQRSVAQMVALLAAQALDLLETSDTPPRHVAA